MLPAVSTSVVMRTRPRGQLNPAQHRAKSSTFAAPLAGIRRRAQPTLLTTTGHESRRSGIRGIENPETLESREASRTAGIMTAEIPFLPVR